jgi:hypothetical protein
MKKFLVFFSVIFLRRKITDERLQKYTEDHLQRLAANNNSNQFDVMINETEAAHSNYFGALKNEDLALALRQSRTVSVDNVIDRFKARMNRAEGAIRDKWGKDSDVYEEFFPHGLNEFTHINKTTYESLIARFISSLTGHQGDLGAVILADFTTLQSDYITARGQQLLKKGEVDMSRADKTNARMELAFQLQKNILDIAKMYLGDVQKGMSFFDTSTLYSRKHGEDEEAGEEYTLTILPMKTVEAGIAFNDDTAFLFYNSGDQKLALFTSPLPDQINPPANVVYIEPDEELVLDALHLGMAGNRFLYIYNPGNEEGEITISLA